MVDTLSTVHEIESQIVCLPKMTFNVKKCMFPRRLHCTLHEISLQMAKLYHNVTLIDKFYNRLLGAYDLK